MHHYCLGVDPPEYPARDPDVFSVLKDITSLDSWLLSFMDVAQTQPHGVGMALESLTLQWTSLTQNSLWRIKGFFLM